MTAFDYVAFGAMIVVFCGIIYAVIWLGDMPAKIAKERNHPQVSAVQAMAWFGLLFTGGILWIVAMVWAYYEYAIPSQSPSIATLEAEIEKLRARVDAIDIDLSKSEDAL